MSDRASQVLAQGLPPGVSKSFKDCRGVGAWTQAPRQICVPTLTLVLHNGISCATKSHMLLLMCLIIELVKPLSARFAFTLLRNSIIRVLVKMFGSLIAASAMLFRKLQFAV